MDNVLIIIGFIAGFIAYLGLPAFVLIRQNAINKKKANQEN